MTEPDNNELSEIIKGYIEGRPFQSLSSILKNSGFYNQSNSASKINSLEDSEYKSLKRHFSNLRKTVINEIHQREEQSESNGNVDSFLQFVSLLFDVSTIIQKRDEQTIANLKETKESQEESSASKHKSKGDSDTKSSKSQAETISKLKRKLSKAFEQITFLKAQVNLAKDEGKNEVIQDITDHYHLNQSSGTDIQNLINSLDNAIESNASTIPSDSGDGLNENLTVLKKIVKSFDLPQETTSQNVVSELQQKMVEMAKFNAKMNSQLKEDIENCPIGPNEDPENPSIMRSQLVATINSLRAELDKIRSDLAEQDEILQIFCNIPLKTNEIENIVQEEDDNGKSFIQKVRDIVSILTIQIFQSEDAEATNKRLFSLVGGLFQFINSIGTSKAAYVSLYSDSPFEEMRSVLLSQAERVHLFLSENGQAFTSDQQSLFNELISNNNYNPLKGIDSSSINSMNILAHVKNFLNEYTQKPTTVEGQVLYVIALEAVCACDILQRYSGTVKHAFNRQIYESKQLKDYSLQLEKSIEDQQITIQEMSLLQNEERNNRSENYEYGDNYYDNDRESFSNSMNQNSTSLNTNTNTNSSKINENSRDNENNRRRRNQNENSGIRDSNSTKEKDENVKERDISNKSQNNESVEKELNKVRSILRKGITNHKENDEDCNCIETILEALDHLNQNQSEIIPDERYIQTIQSQLSDKISEIKELKQKNDNLIKETHDDIVNVQDQVSKMNETMNKKIELKKKQNQKLIKALKDAQEIQTKLKKQIKELQEKVQNYESQESDDSKHIADEIQQHFKETKEEYEQKVSQFQKEINTMKESYENQLNSLKQQLESEKEKTATLSKKVDQNDQSIKGKIEKLKKKEAKAIDQASVLSQKYQELHKDYVALENEKKAMMDKYENIEKEKSLVQDSLKNYSETLEEFNKLRKSYDQLRNEKVTENKQFLSKIASLFPTYADFSVTISKESILDILKNVKEDLDTIPTIQGKNNKKDEIIQKVKECLNIESENSIVDKLSKLIKTNNELDQSNHHMYSELKASQESRIVYLQLQDWLIRLYVMVTGGVCQDVTTSEMQHAIEDNITSKYENLMLSRKNALLRAEKKLLLSKTFNKVNKDYIEEMEKENENNNTKNESKAIQNDEEEDQSSTEIEFDAKKDKDVNNDKKKKKKKDKTVYTFRHLLIMAMLICKAKRLSGNGGDPYGLEMTDANAKDGKQFSASLSPISKPMYSSNYVFGLD